MPTALSTDLYEITMAAGYSQAEAVGHASFEMSVRTLPPERGYLVAAGLEPALEYLEHFRFAVDEIDYLRSLSALRDVPASFFEDVLPNLRFTGDVWALPEGCPVFPDEPLLRVTGPIIEAQVVETALLSTLLFQTSVATRASRVVQEAAGRPVFEFGARRANGSDAAVGAARAAFIGGCAGSSMVEAGLRYGLPLSGTMAHSWVMSHPTETDAFVRFMELYGDQAVLLIDTYDSLDAVRQIVEARLRPAAVRLDSGDVVAESRAVRGQLDGAGLTETQIFASGDLDEHRIEQIVHAKAPIDAFGVGTALSTSSDAPALGGVYKLVEVERDGRCIPTLKLSRGKATYPGIKQVWRLAGSEDGPCDLLGCFDEEPPAGGSPLLERVMVDGRRTRVPPPLGVVRARAQENLARLPEGTRRLVAPETYRVVVSQALGRLKAELGRSHIQTGPAASNPAAGTRGDPEPPLRADGARGARPDRNPDRN